MIDERIQMLPGLRQFFERRYESFFAKAEGMNLFRGIFDNFAAAQRSAPRTKPVGYDQPASANTYDNLLDKIHSSDYPVLYWLGQLLHSNQSLFDFGGNVGIKHYAFQKYLTFPTELRWTVCDVPAVTAVGEEIARQRSARSIDFVNDFKGTDGYDILLCSGSLQYIETPFPQMLAGLSKLPKHIVLNMTALTDGPTFVTLNSIGTAFCPYRVGNRQELIDGVQALGYELVDQWENLGKEMRVRFHPGCAVPAYTGMYLRYKGSARDSEL